MYFFISNKIRNYSPLPIIDEMQEVDVDIYHSLQQLMVVPNIDLDVKQNLSDVFQKIIHELENSNVEVGLNKLNLMIKNRKQKINKNLFNNTSSR
jgi:uncharacterized protein YlbG (UPF0298 family)